MVQKVSFEVPKEFVVLTKDEHDDLTNRIDDRVWVTFNDLIEWTSLKRDKLDTILNRYRDELDIENGGPVKYPNGGRWSFEKEGIRSWLKDNHARVWLEDKKR